jgi:hypothetical protein
MSLRLAGMLIGHITQSAEITRAVVFKADSPLSR